MNFSKWFFLHPSPICKHHESQYRALSGGCGDWRIYRRQKRIGLSDYLFQPGIQTGLDADVYCPFMYHSYGALQPTECIGKTL